MSREVLRVIEIKEQSEGDGARVRRSIGSEVKNFDPFLLLDEFNSAAPAGFPDHPHRGFETVTYMLSGRFKHEDFKGHKGIIGPGDLQWMTAGRGIVHCEMPEGTEPGKGLQLWINLSAENKMIEPQYQELLNKDIPVASKDGFTVKVIAGESMGIKSPVYTRTPTMFLEFKLEPGASFVQPIPEDWNAFVFILDGEGVFGPSNKEVKALAHHTVFLSNGDSVKLQNKSNSQLHLVLIGGKPLNEPIVHTGPFVMNTHDQIQQAAIDYHSCINGFENAKNWRSEVAKARYGDEVF